VSYYETTVTSKGQITVPAALRSAWGLKDGDKLEFYTVDGQTFVRPLNAKPSAVFEEFGDEVMVAVTVSDDAAIAEAILEKDTRARSRRGGRRNDRD
jgi:AbrB family looped-hinge helix DNA binding protein